MRHQHIAAMKRYLNLLAKGKKLGRIKVKPINSFFYGWDVAPEYASEYLPAISGLSYRTGGEYNSRHKLWQIPFNPFDLLENTNKLELIDLVPQSYSPWVTGRWLIKQFLPSGVLKTYSDHSWKILITEGGTGGLAIAIAEAFPFSRFPGLELTILE